MADPLRSGRRAWIPSASEPESSLNQLEGRSLGPLQFHVYLGPRSRFGARYFKLHVTDAGRTSDGPILTGLHNAGPLPSYNWIEVAGTQPNARIDDEDFSISEEPLFSTLLAIIPPGGHIMVEYDSPQRAETARALALGIPALLSPLGSLLFKIGCGARFKDWQIAEGGSEGPRKLQAYHPPSEDVAARWRREAARELEQFLAQPRQNSAVVNAARNRAAHLLPQLRR